jgi:hypothetical protein
MASLRNSPVSSEGREVSEKVIWQAESSPNSSTDPSMEAGRSEVTQLWEEVSVSALFRQKDFQCTSLHFRSVTMGR